MHGVNVVFYTHRSVRKIIDRVQRTKKFRMLTRGYRVGSCGCGVNDVSLSSELRLPLLRRHVVDFLLGDFSIALLALQLRCASSTSVPFLLILVWPLC